MFLLFCVFLFFSKWQTRDSGGMIIWTKSELSIELVKREQYHLWLKIKKGIISTSQPVFLCAIYIPPLESPYFQEETFQNIEQEISHFQAQGNVLLMGDFNSRTGDKLDFIESQGSRFITGNNTFFPSTVDYAITDLHLSSLRAFTVKPLKPFSDHSQISLYIKQSQTLPKPIRTPYHMHKIMSFKWTENSNTVSLTFFPNTGIP